MLLKISNIFNKIKNKIESKGKKGQAALELALGFPIVVVMLLFMFDVSRIIQMKFETSMMSRNAVRMMLLIGMPKSQSQSIEMQRMVQNHIISTWNVSHRNNKEDIRFINMNHGSVSPYQDIGGENYPRGIGQFQTYAMYGSEMNTGATGSNLVESRVCVSVGLLSPMAIVKGGDGRQLVCSSYAGYFSSKIDEKKFNNLKAQSQVRR